MSEPYARTSKFGKFLTKLRLSKSNSSTELIPLKDFTSSDNDDFSYLIERRQWIQRYTSEVQTGHGGAPSDKKSDLEICGLLHLQQPDLSDEVEVVSCDTPSEISCSDSCRYGEFALDDEYLKRSISISIISIAVYKLVFALTDRAKSLL